MSFTFLPCFGGVCVDSFFLHHTIYLSISWQVGLLILSSFQQETCCSREMDHAVLLQKILVVSFIVALFWKIIRYMCNLLNVEKEPVRVLVTGAAGKAQILNISFGFYFIQFIFFCH